MSEAERVKWDQRWRERGEALAPPSALLTELDPLLPRAGRALDVAGGSGRHALWLARRGLDVTLVDVSPVAVDLARRHAHAAGLALEAVVADLDRDPLPLGPWDLLLCFHYLNRSLFAAFPDLLAPGGLLVFVQPTRHNLDRHAHPGPDFLLAPGEARALAGERLEVVRLDEDWLSEGRHEARLVARPLTSGRRTFVGGSGRPVSTS